MKKEILVIDAQGGGVGRQLVSRLKAAFPEAYVAAVGTNNAASSNMLKGGADHAATGENAVVVACRTADLIVGPIGIVIADAMYGEITPKMAEAVGSARGRRILIPFQNCYNIIAGVDKPVTQLIEAAVVEAKKLLVEE